MDRRRDSNGFSSIQKTKSQDSALGTGRRRGSSLSGFGPSWLKKLGSKFSHAESEITGGSSGRRNSSASVLSDASRESDTSDTPSVSSVPIPHHHHHHPVREEFRKLGGGHHSPPMQTYIGETPVMAATPRSVPNAALFSEDDPPAMVGLETGRKHSPQHNTDRPLKPAIATPATLSDLKKRKIDTRAVGFALSTFADNPPQRIPPVSPAAGNVEFLNNGKVIVRERYKSHFSTEAAPISERNHSEIVRIAQLKARQNAEKLHSSIAGRSVTSIFGSRAGSVSSQARTSDEEGDDADYDEPANPSLANKDVDGTSHVKLNHNNKMHDSGARMETDDDERLWNPREQPGGPQGMDTPTPDQVYIRCCHLREIMPIRNILRQLQGQLAPIPRVRIANTKPTLVEIQALSDFLTVVPVSSLVIDNRILTDEMFRLIFVGIARSRDIARLTFVNTKMGPLGWQYMCSFIANSRKSLLALNLSCTDPTGIPSRLPPFDRRDMDWRLLVESLIQMGSLEELDLGGTKIDTVDLKYLIQNGFKNGRILGLANNNLQHEDVQFLADWAKQPDSQLMGINLSGNELSRVEDWGIVQSFLTNPRIYQLSLRNSKLSHVHASHILKAVSPEQAKQSNLRSLDLSCNPELFPHIVSRLTAALPNFPYLSRLQLENCNLTSDTIVTLCEAFSHCHRLVYLSVAGNGTLTESAATALCVAVHLSRSICTVEADISESNTVLRQKLAQYCIQNLESNAGPMGGQTVEQQPEEDLLTFHDDLRAVAKIINTSSSEQMSPESQKAVVERIEELRSRIKTRMHGLLIKRRTGPLSINDRETLMRLFFYSTNLDRLKQEAVGSEDVQENPNVEEDVKNVGEEDLRPSLPRMSSQASILSLKKLDREEGESHKAYARKLMDLDDDDMLDAVGKLKVADLEQLMN